MKKKTYIKPVSKIVKLYFVSHLLQDSQKFSTANRSLSRESDDRFDWGAADDDEEPSVEAPQTPW